MSAKMCCHNCGWRQDTNSRRHYIGYRGFSLDLKLSHEDLAEPYASKTPTGIFWPPFGSLFGRNSCTQTGTRVSRFAIDGRFLMKVSLVEDVIELQGRTMFITRRPFMVFVSHSMIVLNTPQYGRRFQGDGVGTLGRMRKRDETFGVLTKIRRGSSRQSGQELVLEKDQCSK